MAIIEHYYTTPKFPYFCYDSSRHRRFRHSGLLKRPLELRRVVVDVRNLHGGQAVRVAPGGGVPHPDGEVVPALLLEVQRRAHLKDA